MKVVGLITEYNPFHNGHKYHIEQAKKLAGADYAVVVMSGNFVQRGAPAIVDKYTRCQMALYEGADLVFELPVTYATASAEYFAMGAIKILDSLGFVDSICFGSECGDISLLDEIASILVNEPMHYKELLNTGLKKGFSFPIARQHALNEYISTKKASIANNSDLLIAALSSPNNILGIEYLKALRKLNSKMTPYTITRICSGYHEEQLTGEISSASSIRQHINVANGSIEDLKESMPASAYEILSAVNHKQAPITEDDFSSLLYYKLLYSTPSSLLEYLDVNEDIAMRITNTKYSFTSTKEFAELLKTKNMTHTRITRILFHILLNIKKYTLKDSALSLPIYLRLLGMKKDASFLIKNSSREDAIPIITKLADAKNKLDEDALAHLELEISASNLYNHIVYKKYGTTLKDEYRKGIVIL